MSATTFTSVISGNQQGFRLMLKTVLARKSERENSCLVLADARTDEYGRLATGVMLDKPMDATDTTTLLQAARAGSREALEELFKRCGPRLLALIRLRLGPDLRARLESRDVLANCLLTAFQKIDQLRQADGASLLAWLARIAENEIKDLAEHHHRQRRDIRREVSFEDEHLVPEIRSLTSRVIADEQLQLLERALETLVDEHREVIILRKLYELSYPEIGERMGRSADACRMLLARAMTELTLATEGSM
ncbi:MAG: sigma-70 family RNA polymerase sigma factor [Gammaproteobacteria bacterium]|nr:sigma-70 family RNA polymerase sigma factor [Gammaproteobacteria bacterium]